MRPTALELREVAPADLEVHFEQQRDAASNALAAVAARDRVAFDAHWAALGRDPEVVLRSVVVDGAVAGSVLSFVRGGERMVGYWIARERWGQGIATAALRALLALVPDRPLGARVAWGNDGSLRVLEKCGFARVGEERLGEGRVHVLRLGAPGA